MKATIISCVILCFFLAFWIFYPESESPLIAEPTPNVSVVAIASGSTGAEMLVPEFPEADSGLHDRESLPGDSVDKDENSLAEWWRDPDLLTGYYARYDAGMPSHGMGGSIGFEHMFGALQKLDRELQEDPDAQFTKVEWAEMGEIDGATAFFVWNALRAMKSQYKAEIFRPSDFERFVKLDPFRIHPDDAIKVIAGGVVELSPEQEERLQKIFFARLAERGGVSLDWNRVYAVESIARQVGPSVRLPRLPPGSEFYPAEYSKVTAEVEAICSGYRDDLAMLIFQEGIKVESSSEKKDSPQD